MACSFLILGSFVIFQMSLNPWAGCEGYAECERALELNGCQVLFDCGHGRYWYLGDQVLQEWKGIILNSFKLICKVSWLA